MQCLDSLQEERSSTIIRDTVPALRDKPRCSKRLLLANQCVRREEWLSVPLSVASYLGVLLCPGRTIYQKHSRNPARMGLWVTEVSGKVRGRNLSH